MGRSIPDGLRPALVLALTAAAIAGCSGTHRASSIPSTAPTTAPSSTAVSGSPAGVTAPGSSSTSRAPARSTTTVSASANVSIHGFTVSPSSPVECNGAPGTMVELKWTSSGASSVDLAIDGAHFASYGGGAQDHLEYLACDGKPHTYTLTARGGAARATSSVVIVSKSG